jgi:hypothetical protein
VHAAVCRANRVRAAGGAALFAIGLATVLFLYFSPRQHDPLLQPNVASPMMPFTPADLLDLERESHALTLVAHRLQAQQREWHHARLDDSRIGDPLVAVHQHTERTARRMMLEADRLAMGRDGPKSSRQVYQRVCELFPQSHWAQVARARLEGLSTTDGVIGS